MKMSIGGWRGELGRRFGEGGLWGDGVKVKVKVIKVGEQDVD